MCRRQVFEEVGGFDENLAVAYNDVDFCLKMSQKGYRNIYLPHAKLYHYESKSRGFEDTPEKQQRLQRETARLRQRWEVLIANDPCYNPNLTRLQEDYSLNIQTNVIARVTEVSSLDKGETEFLWDFSIDSPRMNEIFNGFIPIRGWILGKDLRIVAVEIIYKSQVLRRIPVKYSRPDVAINHSCKVEAGSSGFSFVLSVVDFSSIVELALQAILENQNRVNFGILKLEIT
jgi:hypothetical protein